MDFDFESPRVNFTRKLIVFMNKVCCLLLVVLFGCVPEQDIQFKKVKNISITASGSTPLLKGDLLLHNPNSKKMKLKKLDLVVQLNGKEAGLVNQKLNQIIPAQADFTVPIEVTVSLKEMGLLDAIAGILGGKKNTVRITGKIRGSINGFALSVPVDYTEEIKIKR
jgi:LEA14-like dessication related protein